MAFDPASVGGDVAAYGAHCKAGALAAIAAGQAREAHEFTKSWVGYGGGGHIPEAWLVYAVSGLMDGQPRLAVHCFDMALSSWVRGPADRAALTWCRGLVVMNILNDPKTALLDLEDAAHGLPGWLAEGADEALAKCRQAAARSRKTKPSVKPRPARPDWESRINCFAPGMDKMAAFAPDVSMSGDGDYPDVWPVVAPFFDAPKP